MTGVETIVGDPVYGTEKVVDVKSPVVDSEDNGSSSTNVHIAGTMFKIDSNNQLHRKLTGRQIQLFAIGGTIGSGVFLAMGSALAKGGAASLFLAYVFYSCIVGMVNNSAAEMATFMPINAAFIRHPSKWVDQAWGFMVGWNYFIYVCLGLPFEITGVSIFLTFWRDDIPVAAVICACIVIYILLNIFAVNYYGEAEFWLALGKCLLFVIVFSFTFITMVGGNPLHDAYGFRYWKNPGAFMPYMTTGNLGRFEGFLACYWQASYLIAGPDYVSLVAGEAIQPRKTLRAAFKTMYVRFAVIFVGSALCIGIVVPANDPTLLGILGGEIAGAGTGSASPYIIAMKRLHITVLPHIVNALLVTSVFSAGNSYVYAGTRSLYGLAMQGQAPKFLRKCTKSGVPIYCMAVTICFALLAFLQLNNNSAVVYQWLINVNTAAGLVDYITISVTYIFFYRACKAQGVDRQTLPYRGWGQPYMAWVSLIMMVVVVFCFGYTGFMPWDVGTFFSYYTMLLLAPITYTFWKVTKRTKFIKPLEADLVWVRPSVDAYEASLEYEAPGFWLECLQMLGVGKTKHKHAV